MKITREINGKQVEFELTPSELYLAFEEQQEAFDKEDILMYIDGFDSEDFESYGVSEQAFRHLVPTMAYLKRRYQDKYDMDWQSARDEAIKDAIYRYKNEQEEAKKHGSEQIV